MTKKQKPNRIRNNDLASDRIMQITRGGLREYLRGPLSTDRDTFDGIRPDCQRRRFDFETEKMTRVKEGDDGDAFAKAYLLWSSWRLGKSRSSVFFNESRSLRFHTVRYCDWRKPPSWDAHADAAPPTDARWKRRQIWIWIFKIIFYSNFFYCFLIFYPTS